MKLLKNVVYINCVFYTYVKELRYPSILPKNYWLNEVTQCSRLKRTTAAKPYLHDKWHIYESCQGVFILPEVLISFPRSMV